MRADMLAKVNQIPVDVLSEDADEQLVISKTGQTFTADWKTRLVLAGKAYRMSWGTIQHGTSIVKVGYGDIIDPDIPQGIIAIDSGYIVPMELNLGLASLAAATSNVIDVLVTADRATAVSGAELAAATGTAETPDNLLDGAEAFQGRALTAATIAVTDPVHSDILYFGTFMTMGTAVTTLDLTVNKEWDYPNYIAGPCSLLLYWGGTIDATSIGSFVFAHIPASWVPTS